MAKRQQAREWPYKAGAVADAAIDAFGAIELEAASISGQAKAIGGMAEGCIALLGEGNTVDVQHMLLSMWQMTVPQQQLCVNIRERCTTHRAALAGARRGEY